MPAEITMPQLSDTMTEGTLVKWRKKEGDKVKAGEVIAEIETDKATMEMEAYESGTLAHIAVAEGEKVPVGTAIAVLATGKESLADVTKELKSVAKFSAPTAEKASTSGGSKQTEIPASTGAVATIEAPSRGEIREPDESDGHYAAREPATPVPPIVSGHGGNGHSRVKISPLAKRIASENSLDLAQITGSGPNGRIIQRDVLAFLERPVTARPSASTPTVAATAPAAEAVRLPRGQTVVIPLTKMRATIATRLQQAKQQIPHFYTMMDVDVEEISNLRVRLNQQLESEKIRLSLGDFIAKAVAATLMRHPALNATFDGQQITRHGGVNLGIAVALPDGLIVPVLRGVDQMGLKEIRSRSADLVDRARAQRLRRDELSGATFSVSNLGTYGLREFSAIINPPEVGILAVAAAEKRAVVRNDVIVPRTMMTLTLSADHRAVDGATAADFLRTLKHLLEDPGMMLV